MKGILSSKLATGMLMLAAFMANIFATMPCRGRCYEPMLPEELRHHTGEQIQKSTWAYCYYAKKSAVLENRPSVPQIKTTYDNYSILGRVCYGSTRYCRKYKVSA